MISFFAIFLGTAKDYHFRQETLCKDCITGFRGDVCHVRACLFGDIRPVPVKERRGVHAPRHFAAGSMHPRMTLSISALDSTPISATNTIRVRGIPAVGGPTGASVARPPAN